MGNPVTTCPQHCMNGEYNSCFVIGVAGGTASGKTTACDHIMQRLREQCVVIISQDSFYKGLSPKQLQNVQGTSMHLDYLSTPIRRIQLR